MSDQGNQLPLPRQISTLRHVANIKCENKYGIYVTPVYARHGEKSEEAIKERQKDLRALCNTILEIKRLPAEDQGLEWDDHGIRKSNSKGE
jgi:hypothetical protein